MSWLVNENRTLRVFLQLVPTILWRRGLASHCVRFLFFFLGKRGVKYQGHASSSRYECTRRRNPQFITQARGQIEGERQWVKEITRKRKEQRSLLKAEKRSKAKDKHLLQRSAVSDPPYIPGAMWLPLPRRKLEQQDEEEEKQKLIE